MSIVADVVETLERAYPPRFAESWDRVGLICGDPAESVKKVAFALDCTQAVAEAAVAAGAQMLVVHHPLLLKGVNSVATNTPKGKVIHTLITGGCALFAAHTNADCARPGVNDELASLVGLSEGPAIRPILSATLDKWGVQVPALSVEPLKSALFDAGAGAIGDYRECSFDIPGRGQFRPVEGADPAVGSVGALEHVDEIRVEFVAPRRLRAAVLSALRSAHPYEEPAFDIVEMASEDDATTAPGLGRIGELPEPMTLRDFTQQVADALPETVWGVRSAGDPDALIKRVAVCSGSGDSLLDEVRSLGVDAYVTSDLRHHPVDEYLRAGGPAVIDTAHYASEFPWTRQAASVVEKLGVETQILDIRTDPWVLSAHKS